MAAGPLGPPIWQNDVWEVTVWEEGTWEYDGSGGLIPDLAMIRERQRRQAARRDWLVFLRGGR